MVLSIILLALSLVLTFGGTLKRMFDRLKICFSFSIALQIVLLVIVILPHILIEDKVVLNLIALICLFMVTIIYALNIWSPKTIMYVVFICLIVCGVEIALLLMFSTVYHSNFLIEIVMSIISSALIFAFAKEHGQALLSTLLSNVFLLIVFFSLNAVIIDIENRYFIIAIINIIIYTMFLTMLFMNLFKRKRLII